MADYIPSPREWVRDQVELYDRSGGTDGTTTQARNDKGSPHSENDKAPQPSGAIVCLH